MAWRFDEHILRGELDNRTRGRTCKWSLMIVAAIALSFLASGCAYSRLGRLIYLPSDKDPKWRLFMAITYLGGDKEEEEIPTKRILQVELRERIAVKDELFYLRRLAYRRKLMASADIDFDYTFSKDTLTVKGIESATKLVYHGARDGISQYTTEPRKNLTRRSWSFIFRRDEKGDFVPIKATGDFL